MASEALPFMTSPVTEVTTLGDLLVMTARRRPEHEAVVFPDRRVTYAQLLEAASHRARSLRAMGIGPGDHVGILMPNLVEYTEILFGVTLIGAVAVPINSRYKETELAYLIKNADLDVVVTTDVIAEHVDFVGLLHRSLPGLVEASDPHALHLTGAPRLRSVVLIGDSAPDGIVDQADFEAGAATVEAAEIELLRSRVSVRDVCIMMYTSGTTAHPKGCPLSHEAVVRSGRAMARHRFMLEDDDRMWDPLPMFHMSSILPLAATIDAGGTFISLTHVAPEAALDQIITERPTSLFPTFPTLTAALVHHPRWKDVDVGIFRVVNNVAPPDALREFQAAYPDAVQVSAYGLTEATGVAAFNELSDTLEQRVATCGRPFPGIELQVVDPDSNTPLPTGERGEIVIRGYCLFEGYYGDEENTAAAVDADGWLHTGDLGSLDPDGRISYHGRLKDMLKVGGENVGAIEIESYLGTHPAVKLAQVVGAPDDKYVEVPAAFIELHDGAKATAEELAEFCKDRIASYKIPRYIRFVTEWPMSTTKIQKYRLRDQLIEELSGPS